MALVNLEGLPVISQLPDRPIPERANSPLLIQSGSTGKQLLVR